MSTLTDKAIARITEESMKIRKCVICGKAFAPEDVRKLTCSAECTLKRRRRDSKARYWAKKKEAEKRYGERISKPILRRRKGASDGTILC